MSTFLPSRIRIGNIEIGPDRPPLIIAEISGNHNQSLQRALELVDAAAAAGAHALKLQTYTADTMTLDLDRDEFFISDTKSLWQGRSLHKLYQEAHTPWEWHEAIFDRCRKAGMIAFSTPFDATAVDFLEKLGAPCFKIASFENTDLPLIRKVAATGKPMIISTGMATEPELAESVSAARAAGCKDLILLKCTSSYPATPTDSNVLTIPHMRELFGCNVGLSDHTMGIGVAVASVSLGASRNREALHFAPRRWRRRFGILPGAGRIACACHGDRPRVASPRSSQLWPDKGRAQFTGFPAIAVRGSGHARRRRPHEKQPSSDPPGRWLAAEAS